MSNPSNASAPNTETAKTLQSENTRNMNQRFPTLSRILFGLISVFWTLFGWIVILQGSFSGHTRQSKPVYIDGNGAIGMAFLAFAFAALVGLILLRIYERKWPHYVTAMALLFIPPILVVWMTA